MSWGKLHRLVSVELSLRRDQRVNCQDFIRIARAEVDRLIEMSPMMPQSVLRQFRAEFSDHKDLKKPDICNGIDHTTVCMDAAAVRFTTQNGSGGRSATDGTRGSSASSPKPSAELSASDSDSRSAYKVHPSTLLVSK
jgi:hypothetical protein